MRIKTNGILASLLALALLFSGCSSPNAKEAVTKNNSSGSQRARTVHIGYYGGTCEAPIYVAYENGIFKKNGLTVELVKIDANVMKEGISTGKLDALQITPGLFKPIEQGMDIKITGGVHTGCIQAVAPVASPIQSITDLKGKTIGVESMGGVPMTLLSMELIKLGIDPVADVTWKVYPAPQLSQALEKQQIDVFSTWDPFPEMAIKEGKARGFFSNTHSQPYAEQFCCYVGMNGKVVSNEPEIAKAITNSLAEAGDWITAHPQEAAQIGVDKKYTGGDAAMNGSLLAQYQFIADPVKARESYVYYLQGMKQLHMLDATTEIEELVRKSFVDVSKEK